MYSSTNPESIIRLPTAYPPISVPTADSYDNHRDAHTPIIIDNGSTNLRWGFGTSSTPLTGLNMVAKYKERKTNRPLLLFGDGIDSESGARAHAKTPWEGDVLLNFDALVSFFLHILDSVEYVNLIFTSRRRRMHLTMLLFNWVSIHQQLTILS